MPRATATPLAASVRTPDEDAAHETKQGLTETEAAILAFEMHWWKYAGAKERGQGAVRHVRHPVLPGPQRAP